ncbi:hypothetical protein D3C72_893310 [compost metagenome]
MGDKPHAVGAERLVQFTGIFQADQCKANVIGGSRGILKVYQPTIILKRIETGYIADPSPFQRYFNKTSARRTEGFVQRTVVIQPRNGNRGIRSR